MDPILLVGVILALVAGGYAAFKGDARFAGVGVVILGLLALLGARG